jgi:hypothetical protein
VVLSAAPKKELVDPHPHPIDRYVKAVDPIIAREYVFPTGTSAFSATASCIVNCKYGKVAIHGNTEQSEL